eukprot:gene10179-13691_t
MKLNEGAVDRVLRVLVGIAILSLAFVGPKTPWAYLGIVPFLTGIAEVAPATRPDRRVRAHNTLQELAAAGGGRSQTRGVDGGESGIRTHGRR